jgi:hypothetical protein
LPSSIILSYKALSASLEAKTFSNSSLVLFGSLLKNFSLCASLLIVQQVATHLTFGKFLLI